MSKDTVFRGRSNVRAHRERDSVSEAKEGKYLERVLPLEVNQVKFLVRSERQAAANVQRGLDSSTDRDF